MTSKEEIDPIQYLEDVVKSIKPPRIICFGGAGGKIAEQIQQAFNAGYTQACEDFFNHLKKFK